MELVFASRCFARAVLLRSARLLSAALRGPLLFAVLGRQASLLPAPLEMNAQKIGAITAKLGLDLSAE
eukprot:COSAG04_NODE_22147_length_360_cov_1.183908_1_plen_67_part_10